MTITIQNPNLENLIYKLKNIRVDVNENHQETIDFIINKINESVLLYNQSSSLKFQNDFLIKQVRELQDINHSLNHQLASYFEVNNEEK